MNPVGLWTLHFDWGPSGNYSWSPLYFNFDGTFAYLAGDNEGTWATVDDMIVFRFKLLPDTKNNTVYSGTVSRNFMSGMMFSLQGEKGIGTQLRKEQKCILLKRV